MNKLTTIRQDKEVLRRKKRGEGTKDIAVAVGISVWQVYHATRRIKDLPKIAKRR